MRDDDALLAALAAAGREHIQRDPQWLDTITRHALDPGEQALFLCARNDAGAAAIVPLKINHARARADSLGNFYTSDWAPVVPPQGGGELLRAAFAGLAQDRDIVELRLAPLRGRAGTLAVLAQAVADAGWRGCHEYFCFGNWYHDTAGCDYADYLRERPSRLRNTLERRTRQFEQAGGSLELLRDGTALAAAVEEFNEVYAASWKRPEPYPGFIPGLAALAAERGWLRLGLARLAGRAVAAQMWLVADGTAYIFKLAYREDAADYSPGTVLTGFMLHSALDADGVTTIDYLSGDDAYKRDWMSARREYCGIAAYNGQRAAGRARARLHTLKTHLKRLGGRA